MKNKISKWSPNKKVTMAILGMSLACAALAYAMEFIKWNKGDEQ